MPPHQKDIAGEDPPRTIGAQANPGAFQGHALPGEGDLFFDVAKAHQQEKGRQYAKNHRGIEEPLLLVAFCPACRPAVGWPRRRWWPRGIPAEYVPPTAWCALRNHWLKTAAWRRTECSPGVEERQTQIGDKGVQQFAGGAEIRHIKGQNTQQTKRQGADQQPGTAAPQRVAVLSITSPISTSATPSTSRVTRNISPT